MAWHALGTQPQVWKNRGCFNKLKVWGFSHALQFNATLTFRGLTNYARGPKLPPQASGLAIFVCSAAIVVSLALA